MTTSNLKNRFLASVFIFFSFFSSSQIGTISGGGVANGTGGTACYSIGQTDYITASANTATISQGLQQPFELQIMTGFDETDINLSTSVFPNPVSEFLFLKVSDGNSGQTDPT